MKEVNLMTNGIMRAGNTLSVLLNGVLVGQMIKRPNGTMHFIYAASWLSQPEARAISLSLPLRKQVYIGDEVYNFFDNLLPDNPAVRERIQLQKQKIKMAMAFMGKNKHYHWDNIQPRHFLYTAKIVGFPIEAVKKMLLTIKNKTPEVIKSVKAQIPAGFPEYISQSILEGIQKQSERL